MSWPRLIPRADATTDSSRQAIARCYDYLVERRRLRQQKVGGPTTAPDDRTKVKGDSADDIIPDPS